MCRGGGAGFISNLCVCVSCIIHSCSRVLQLFTLVAFQLIDTIKHTHIHTHAHRVLYYLSDQWTRTLQRGVGVFCARRQMDIRVHLSPLQTNCCRGVKTSKDSNTSPASLFPSPFPSLSQMHPILYLSGPPVSQSAHLSVRRPAS